MQENAAGARWNLATGSEALEQRLTEGGAAKALLQALTLHRAVATVQENAAGALWNLAAYDPAPAVAAVQENVAGALWDLAASSVALQQWLAEAGESAAALGQRPAGRPRQRHRRACGARLGGGPGGTLALALRDAARARPPELLWLAAAARAHAPRRRAPEVQALRRCAALGGASSASGSC